MSQFNVPPVTGTPQGGLSYDAITDGGVATGENVARGKMGFGVAGAYTEISYSNPFPVNRTTKVVTGSISTTDSAAGNIQNNGTPITTAPTTGSIVVCECRPGDSSYRVDLTGGVGGGFVFFELSANSTNGSDGSWVAARAQQLGTPAVVLGAASLGTLGAFAGPLEGATWFRVRSFFASFGTALGVRIAVSQAEGAHFTRSLQSSAFALGSIAINGSSGFVINDGIADPASTARGLSVRPVGGAQNLSVAATNITTQNLVAAGVATAGSAVEISVANGIATLGVQVTGTYTGALSLQGTLNGTTWITIGGAPFVRETTKAFSATIASGVQDIFQVEVAGYLKVRITALAAVTGTAAVTLYGSTAVGLVSIDNTVPVSGTVAISGNPAVVGAAAHSAASSGNPVRVAGRVATAVDTTLVAGDVADLAMTTGGAAVQRPFAVPELDWSYAAAAGGITNTTDVAIKAAAGAGVRNYLTAISIQNASSTIATEVVVKDGSTVIWRGFVGNNLLLNSAVNMTFPTPPKSSANAALNVACITTGAQVYVNAQGFTAP